MKLNARVSPKYDDVRKQRMIQGDGNNKLRQKRETRQEEMDVFSFMSADIDFDFDIDKGDHDQDVGSKSCIPVFLKRKSKDKRANSSNRQANANGIAGDSNKSSLPWKKAGAEKRTPRNTHTTKGVSQKNAEKTQVKVLYERFGDITELEVRQENLHFPRPAADHVLVKVQASTVNLNDCLLRKGFDFSVFSPLALPATPGYDVVGHITEVGDRVENFEAGERVAALVRSGGNARYASVPASSLVKIPACLDSAEAAALVTIYTTAYQALRTITRDNGPMYSLEGENVLIIGGMDGVGQALIQMCKKAKATIFAPAPKHRHVYLKNILGVIPLPEENWLSHDLIGKINYVFDGVCADSEMFQSMADGGEIVRYGKAALLKENGMGYFGAPVSARIKELFNTMSWRIHTVDIWESFRSDPETFKHDLSTLTQALKYNRIKPHIAKRISLAEVGIAMTKLETGGIRGTTVCLPWRPMPQSKIANFQSL